MARPHGMPSGRRLTAACLALALGLLALQPTHARSDAVTEPLTAGGVALLVGRPPSDRRVPDRLRDALAAEDAGVRAVAARVILALGFKSHIRYLVPALAREQNLVAARQELRAVMHLLGPAADDLAQSEARRFGGALSTTVFEVMGRARPDALLSRLPDLFMRKATSAGAGSQQAREGQTLAMVALQHPHLAATLARSVLTHGTWRTWTCFLDVLARWDVLGPDEAIVEALQSQEANTRVATLASLVDWRASGRPLSARVIAAATAGDPIATWEGYARELLHRMEGKPARGDWASTLAAAADVADPAQRLLFVDRDLLTKRERKTLRDAGFDLPRGATVTEGQHHENRSGHATVRTAAAVVPRLFTELINLTQCQGPRGSDVGLMRLSYRADGLPAQITLDNALTDTGCEQLARVLGTLSLAAPDLPIVDDTTDTHVLLFKEPFLSCVATAEVAEPELAAWARSDDRGT